MCLGVLQETCWLKYKAYLLLQEENIANIAEENEVSLSFTAGFMGNPMMKMDSVSKK